MSSLRLERRELGDRRTVRFSADDLHRRLKEKILEIESDRRNTPARRQRELREPMTPRPSDVELSDHQPSGSGPSDHQDRG